MFEMGAKFDNNWLSDNKKEKQNKITKVLLADAHSLYITKEKRRGKIVTIAKEFFILPANLKELLKIIKKKLSTGGAIKNNTLELQGDVSSKLKEILKQHGYKFKK